MLSSIARTFNSHKPSSELKHSVPHDSVRTSFLLEKGQASHHKKALLTIFLKYYQQHFGAVKTCT